MAELRGAALLDAHFALQITVNDLPVSNAAERERVISAMLACLPDGSAFVLGSGPSIAGQAHNARDAGKYRMLRDTISEMISAQDQG